MDVSEHLEPHRGVLLLVLGICALVLCPFIGCFVWPMANGDLREIDAGRMDPEGRSMTQAGKILSIISLAIFALPFLILGTMVLLMVVGSVAG